MTPALQARAALEIRRRRIEGHGVGVLVQQRADCWRYRDQQLTDAEAEAVRKNYRGQLIVVHRESLPLPGTEPP